MATPTKPPSPEPPKPPPPSPPNPASHEGAKLDPQDAKLKPSGPVPPKWEEPKPPKEPEAWSPEPALHPQEQAKGHYPDGMTAADEQRARSAWIEAHGLKAWREAVEDKAATPQTVPGVRPSTQDEMREVRR